MRSGLAILGIAVAVASVICVVSIGRTGTQNALAELDKLGDNLVWVEAGARNIAGTRTGTHGMTTLVASDAQAIRDEVSTIRAVSENTDGRIQVVARGQNWNTSFRGVSPEYQQIKRWDVALGGFFDADQTRHAATVIVIGETVRRQLFGDDDDPIGQTVRIQTSVFEVVGVLAPKGANANGNDQDDTIMMPWTTVMLRINGRDVTWLDDVLCSATSPDDIPHATETIQSLLRDRHHIATGGDDDFNIRHPEELLQARIKSRQTLETLLLCLASIALVVGGIGIMNVMLASVAQRTREIGLRLAVGAPPAAIRLQFLGEAVMMTVIGGAIGVAIAAASSATITGVLGWDLPNAGDIDALALAFSALVGVFFGLYPAVRASRLPIRSPRCAPS